MKSILKFFKLFSKRTFNDLLNSFDTTSRLDALSQLSQLFNIRKAPENTNRDKRLEEYLRQFTKYGNNYEKVLFNYEKRINFESEKVMKNISKIYSLLPSENESELHSKINKKTMKESYINYEFYKKKMEEEMKQPNFFKKYLDEYNMNSKNENPPPKK